MSLSFIADLQPGSNLEKIPSFTSFRRPQKLLTMGYLKSTNLVFKDLGKKYLVELIGNRGISFTFNSVWIYEESQKFFKNFFK